MMIVVYDDDYYYDVDGDAVLLIYLHAFTNDDSLSYFISYLCHDYDIIMSGNHSLSIHQGN